MNQKYLGIDYGEKKIGLATSDENGKFAFPFSILQNSKNKEKREEIINSIFKILKEKKIQNIVIGESLNLKGEENKLMKSIKEFAKELEIKTSSKVYFEKEWFSTLEARRFNDRKNADDSAAAIILQRFLDKINNKKS